MVSKFFSSIMSRNKIIRLKMNCFALIEPNTFNLTERKTLCSAISVYLNILKKQVAIFTFKGKNYKMAEFSLIMESEVLINSDEDRSFKGHTDHTGHYVLNCN